MTLILTFKHGLVASWRQLWNAASPVSLWSLVSERTTYSVLIVFFLLHIPLIPKVKNWFSISIFSEYAPSLHGHWWSGTEKFIKIERLVHLISTKNMRGGRTKSAPPPSSRDRVKTYHKEKAAGGMEGVKNSRRSAISEVIEFGFISPNVPGSVGIVLRQWEVEAKALRAPA